MREAFRPFTKLVTVTGQDRVAVPLRDTGNDSLTCNYIKVEAVSGAPVDGFFFVTPTNVNTEHPITSVPAASGLDALSPSGMPGIVASMNTGSVVLSLQNRDASFSIFLSHTTAGSVVYAVSYGVVNTTNSRADGTLDWGN